MSDTTGLANGPCRRGTASGDVRFTAAAVAFRDMNKPARDLDERCGLVRAEERTVLGGAG